MVRTVMNAIVAIGARRRPNSLTCKLLVVVIESGELASSLYRRSSGIQIQ